MTFPHPPSTEISESFSLVDSCSTLDASRFADEVSRLAGYLASQNLGRGSFIGIAIPRSSPLLIAIHGTSLAGAAYVPLDPDYPDARLSHMIHSAKLAAILTVPELSARFSALTSTPVINTHHRGTPLLSCPAHPEDPLYAIFTSGSTGDPKAAVVLRKGFSHLLAWYRKILALGTNDRTLVISSPSFDLTQKNLHAPLLTGGRLVLDPPLPFDLTRILDLIHTHGITILNCTPSAFYPLIEAQAQQHYAKLRSLRWVILGGEPISLPRLRPWLSHPFNQASIANTYGPTECTDIAVFYEWNSRNLDDYPFVPLGSEIAGVTVSLRDDQLVPVPDGDIGELCIQGPTVGLGYLNDPERTHQRFITLTTEARLYRTGDLARRLPNGILEFRGRADHQVKVDGHRVELGEIERTLQQHHAVRDAVVLLTETGLNAWFQGSATAADLKNHLASSLPAYMIPGRFHHLDQFPLTPNGKIDRLALEKSSITQTPSAKPSNPTAANDLTSRILDIWSQLLGQTLTDPSVNFFDLGGTSIHLAVVHVRLRDLTGRDLAITDLFACPTASSLAAFLEAPPALTQPSQAFDRARLQQSGFQRFRKPSPR